MQWNESMEINCSSFPVHSRNVHVILHTSTLETEMKPEGYQVIIQKKVCLVICSVRESQNKNGSVWVKQKQIGRYITFTNSEFGWRKKNEKSFKIYNSIHVQKKDLKQKKLRPRKGSSCYTHNLFSYEQLSSLKADGLKRLALALDHIHINARVVVFSAYKLLINNSGYQRPSFSHTQTL